MRWAGVGEGGCHSVDFVDLGVEPSPIARYDACCEAASTLRSMRHEGNLFDEIQGRFWLKVICPRTHRRIAPIFLTSYQQYTANACDPAPQIMRGQNPSECFPVTPSRKGPLPIVRLELPHEHLFRKAIHIAFGAGLTLNSRSVHLETVPISSNNCTSAINDGWVLANGAKLLCELLPLSSRSALSHAHLISFFPSVGTWTGASSSSQIWNSRSVPPP